LPNGNQKRQPEAAIETATRSGKTYEGRKYFHGKKQALRRHKRGDRRDGGISDETSISGERLLEDETSDFISDSTVVE
jgi:hypothetical protein